MKAKAAQPRKRLTEAREKHGWSQQEVADQLGAAPTNVSRWERGVTRPSPFFRKKLCLLFGKSEQDLDLALEGDISLTNHGDSLTSSQMPGGMTPSESALSDSTIPMLPLIPLIGREEELAKLRQRLRSGGDAALTVLNGLPGVGKTTLAITLAHDPDLRQHFQDGILWAGLGPHPNIQSHLSRWGMLLGISQDEMRTFKDPVDWASSLRRAIGSRALLLVIDDAWTVEDALMLKVGGQNCTHLVTTRFPVVASQMTAEGMMTLKELDNDEGIQLLSVLAPDVVEEGRQKVRELVIAVGGLPLALNLIGNYLRSSADQARHSTQALQRLSNISERFQASEEQVPAKQYPGLPGDALRSLQTVIALTEQQLTSQAKQALYALAVFPPRPNTFSEEAALAVIAAPVEILDQLADTGLLESSGADRYSLHQTIADYARLPSNPDDAQQRLVDYLVIFAETHQKDYDLLDRENGNILAALEMTTEQTSGTQLIRIAIAVAPFLLARGLYQIAESHLQRAYAAALVQPDHSGLASTLLYLGEMAWKRGDYKQAEKYLQEGLVYAREVDGHDCICAILANLGSISWKSGDYKQANMYLREGLLLARKLKNLERMCELLQILGSVERMQGNYTQAEMYLQEGLKLTRQIEERELTCPLLLNLGAIAAEQGDYEQAEISFQEGLSLARQINHSEWISAFLNNLGDVATEQTNYEQAISYFQEGLELARRIEHQEWVSFLLFNLGLTNRKLMNYLRAEQYLQESYTLAQKLGIPQITCFILNEYGNLHLDKHLKDLAEKDFEEMLANAPEGGQDFVALAHYGLARVASIDGRLEEAWQLGTRSVAVLEGMGRREAREVESWLRSIPKNLLTDREE